MPSLAGFVAGLQAVMPDAVLMAVATARPASPSALINCAQDALSSTNNTSALENGAPAMLYKRLRQDAKQVGEVSATHCMQCKLNHLPERRC